VTFRQWLHRLRKLDGWLIPPALLVVIYGELAHSRLVGVLERNVWDKALHFTAYYGLSLMATIAVRADVRKYWWALGLIALGGALEIIQGFTGRDADIFDELANTIGVLVGLGVGWAGIAFLKWAKLVDDGRAD
jgi:VanZ like family